MAEYTITFRTTGWFTLTADSDEEAAIEAERMVAHGPPIDSDYDNWAEVEDIQCEHEPEVGDGDES